MPELPSGTVTFLFTDVEGSTRLLVALGDGYADALAAHRRTLRAAVSRHGGVEVDTQGDAFFFVFARASDAIAAAEEAQSGLELPVRMGVHTGEPTVTGDGYVGLDVHVAARIAAAGHGGQTLLSHATRELVDADVCDLGEHRLKDLGEPVHLFQLGRAEFPPPRTLTSGNVPVPTTPLLGRKKELVDLRRLVGVEDARLVTITGPGGIGKTRLALALGVELVEFFANGVWFVDLSPVRDPRLVSETIADTIGASDGLAGHLASREVLLVLDNLEHVIEAAPELGGLLATSPNLAILATSREPLRVGGEREYPLPLLAEAVAVELFRQRAQAVDPAFDASYDELVQICRRLDRLPLAIELAAARTRTFPAGALLSRLDRALPLLTRGGRDLPERQRTIEATIAWSYELLSEDEQELFRRLAVFVGGFTVEAAEQVCDATVDGLESLVEKSLVRRTGDRFTMLETVREFARARLEQSGVADEIADRHADWVLRIAEQADDEIESAEEEFSKEHPDEDWFDRLDDEHANVRAALRFLLDRDDCERAARIGFAVRYYWLRRDHAPEGARWLSEALECPADVPPAAQARALYGLGLLSFMANRLDAAEDAYERLRELSTVIDDPKLPPAAYTGLGNVARARGDLEQARSLYERSLTLARRLGDRNDVYYLIHLLGELARDEGDFERAAELLTSARAMAAALRSPTWKGNTTHSLADLALDQNELAESAALYAEALRIYLDTRSAISVAYCLAGLACVAAGVGDRVRAGRLWGAAQRMEDSVGNRMLAYERERYERRLAGLSGTDVDAAVADGRRLTLDEAVEYAVEGVDV